MLVGSRQESFSAGYTCYSATNNLSVSTSDTFSLTTESVVDITAFDIWLGGRHGGCEVYLDTATLTLDGVTIWSQFVNASGSSKSCCDWYVSLTPSVADLTQQVLSAGTHTLTLTLTGEGIANGEAIGVSFEADVEYGTDWDGDGETSTLLGGDDCDDYDATINTSATEIWYDGTDQDCDGESDYDQDKDGEDSDAYGGTDCDDTEPTVNTSATETWYDGIDQDCDGASDYDQDKDGEDSDAYGGTDCDDTEPTIYAAATEIWYDGVDQDCDGASDYDQDKDGFEFETDCDDTNANIFPGATFWTEDCEFVGFDDGTRSPPSFESPAVPGTGCQCSLQNSQLLSWNLILLVLPLWVARIRRTRH